MEKKKAPQKPYRITPMFAKYIAELVVRTALLACAVFFLITNPAVLDISTQFSLEHGLTFVDIAFMVILLDMATKLVPNAKIAIGSRKQYHTFHKPTAHTVNDEVQSTMEIMKYTKDSTNASRSLKDTSKWANNLPDAILQSIESLFEKHVSQPATETVKGINELSRQVARQLSTLSGKHLDDELLESNEKMRDDIRRNRVREIVPVVVVWVLFNALVAMILLHLGLLSPDICLIWALFYFVSDMICVVAWCPFQVLLMRNRCCTTCQIFNWDAIMAATPLLFAPCLFSWILLAVALVVLIRWEAAFIRNPERFDERTNGALSCANCTDKLCVFRSPLTKTGRKEHE